MVYEFLLTLDSNEISVAFSKDNLALHDIVFNSLKDQDAVIARIGLQIVQHLMIKSAGDSDLSKVVHGRIAKEKH
jgi:hypothetical protein